MTDKARITVAGHPDVNVRVKLRPIEFEAGGEASLTVSTGDIHLHVNEIPYSIFIPFLGRRVVRSLGPFGVGLKPFEAQLRVHGIGVRGEIGGEEAGADVHTHCEYKAEIDIEGEVVERAVAAVITKIVED